MQVGNWWYVRNWIFSCETVEQLQTIEELLDRDPEFINEYDHRWIRTMIWNEKRKLKVNTN